MNNYSISSLLNKQEVKTIINSFEKEGLEIRLVGGCVRNGILERDTKDIDCAVNKGPETTIKILQENNIGEINIVDGNKDFSSMLILNTIGKDPTRDTESALGIVYQLLRTSEPPNLETAQKFIERIFFSPKKYYKVLTGVECLILGHKNFANQNPSC